MHAPKITTEIHPVFLSALDDEAYYDEFMDLTLEMEWLIRMMFAEYGAYDDGREFSAELCTEDDWMFEIIEPVFLRFIVARNIHRELVGVLGFEELSIENEDDAELMAELNLQRAYHFNWAYVIPSLRGKGVFKALMERFNQDVYQSDPRAILLNVYRNAGVEKLWQHLGFKRVRRSGFAKRPIHRIAGMEGFKSRLDLMLRT